MEVQVGKKLDKLYIESLDGKMNRDFWFTKTGEFDGTGSACCPDVSFKEEDQRMGEDI